MDQIKEEEDLIASNAKKYARKVTKARNIDEIPQN